MMLPTAHMINESFAHAMARRVLTQQMPAHVTNETQAREQVKGLSLRVPELARGFPITRESASLLLREQQQALADQVRELFPGDAQMAHVTAQIQAKSGDGDGAPRRERER